MKLSASQLFWIIATLDVVTLIWILPPIEIAKQDTWLSMLVAGVTGVAITFLIVHLSIRYPKQTLVEFSQTLLGKWLGRMIVIPYFIAWFVINGNILRALADFIRLILLDQTPEWILLILITGLMIWLAYSGGITGIGRFCEIVGPIIFLTFIVSFILNAGNVEWHRLLPVYSDSGWVNILKGSIAPASLLAESIILLVIVSFMHHPQKALSKSMLGVGIAAIMGLIATIMVLLVFGPNVSAKFQFPYFLFVRSIDILNFIQNVDVFVIFIAIFGMVAKLSLYLFITSYGMAQLFNVRHWRRLIWFGAPGMFIVAIMIPNQASVLLIERYWQFLVIPICGIGIPLLLWIVSFAKKKVVKA